MKLLEPWLLRFKRCASFLQKGGFLSLQQLAFTCLAKHAIQRSPQEAAHCLGALQMRSGLSFKGVEVWAQTRALYGLLWIILFGNSAAAQECAIHHMDCHRDSPGLETNGRT